MKKRWGVLLLVFFSSALLFGCSRTIDDIMKTEPCVKGTVVEVMEQAIAIQVQEGEEERNSSDRIVVSLAVEHPDSMTHFSVGDKVAVYYDGNIGETYPALIHMVYAIIQIG